MNEKIRRSTLIPSDFHDVHYSWPTPLITTVFVVVVSSSLSPLPPAPIWHKISPPCFLFYAKHIQINLFLLLLYKIQINNLTVFSKHFLNYILYFVTVSDSEMPHTHQASHIPLMSSYCYELFLFFSNKNFAILHNFVGLMWNSC